MKSHKNRARESRESLLRLERGRPVHWKCLAGACPKNCCLLLESPFRSLVSVYGLQPWVLPVTSQDERRILSAVLRGEDMICVLADGKKYFQLGRDGECPCLDPETRLCTIYEHRPTSCRAYPFYVDKYRGLTIDTSCPGFGQGWTEWEIVRLMLKSLVEIYEWQTLGIRNSFSI